MSKLDAKVFSSITPFSKQWILGEETMYEFLNQYQEFLSDKYGIVDLGSLDWDYDNTNNRFHATLPAVFKSATARTMQFYCDKNYECYWHSESFSLNWNNVMYTATLNLYIHDHDYSTAEAFKTAMTGHYAIIPLADNIGRVNLSNLTFSWYGENNCWYISSTWRQSGENNGWCENYSLTKSWLNMPNNSIYLRGDQKYIYVKTDGTRQVKPSGYLYFEKQIIL